MRSAMMVTSSVHTGAPKDDNRIILTVSGPTHRYTSPGSQQRLYSLAYLPQTRQRIFASQNVSKIKHDIHFTQWSKHVKQSKIRAPCMDDTMLSQGSCNACFHQKVLPHGREYLSMMCGRTSFPGACPQGAMSVLYVPTVIQYYVWRDRQQHRT